RAPTARLDPRLLRRPVKICGARAAEIGIRFRASLPPQFPEPGIDLHIGLLVANGKEEFTEIHGTRIVSAHLLKGPTWVVDVCNVRRHRQRTVRKIVIERRW